MKRIRQKFSVLTIALIIGGSVITSCSSAISEKADGGRSSTANTTNRTVMDESRKTEPTKTAENSQTKATDIFSAFKRDEDYQKIIRPKMLQAGWQPARSQDGDDNCADDGEICRKYPELEAGPASPSGDAIFRWQKNDKVVKIYTTDNQIYNRYEFEDSAQQIKAVDVSGKYELAEIGLSGDHLLELKKNNVAMFKLTQEDGSSIGNGSWKWNQANELLTVNLSIKTEIAGGDADEKATVSKAVFQFKKDGKNLKIVQENWSIDRVYIGKIFKKL